MGEGMNVPPRAPQLEENPETPPSSRAEGLLFLHGLESNPGSSLQTDWISLQSKGLSRVFSNTIVQKHHEGKLGVALESLQGLRDLT